MSKTLVLVLTACAASAFGQGPENVLLVVNRRSPESREIAAHYQQKRAIPALNVCTIDTVVTEDVTRAAYDKELEPAVAACLRMRVVSASAFFVAARSISVSSFSFRRSRERSLDLRAGRNTSGCPRHC